MICLIFAKNEIRDWCDELFNFRQKIGDCDSNYFSILRHQNRVLTLSLKKNDIYGKKLSKIT
jgi:hypothetical protein